MATDFPSSPAVGAIHNVSPGKSFVWDGSYWAPAPVSTALPKNFLVNPAMQVSQQNGTTTGTVSNYYPADQWVGHTTIASPEFSSAGPSAGVYFQGNFCRQRVVVAKGVLAAGDYISLMQSIEGYRTSELKWGSSVATDVVLRFAAHSDMAGTFTVSLRNSANNRSWLGAFNLPAQGVLYQYSMAITGDTTGTWLVDAGVGITVAFTFASGTTYGSGTPAWQTGNHLALAGSTNSASIGLQHLRIGEVGLYADPYKTKVAPPFVIPDYAQELRRCQRYWYKQMGLRGGASSPATSIVRLGGGHPAPMRAIPAGSIVGAVGLYDGSAVAGLTGLTNVSNEFAAEFDGTAAAGLIIGAATLQYYQSETIYVAMSARY